MGALALVMHACELPNGNFWEIKTAEEAIKVLGPMDYCGVVEWNNMGGNPQKRAEGDLASEVRSKLETNIPSGKLTVSAKNAEITVAGVVKTQEQLDKIKPLAMEITGVRSVMVKAVVKP